MRKRDMWVRCSRQGGNRSESQYCSDTPLESIELLKGRSEVERSVVKEETLGRPIHKHKLSVA